MTELAPATITPIGKAPRHRWGDASYFQYKTERACTVCNVVKVTRHEPGEHPWLEFWRDGERIPGDLTPPCKVTEVAP